jgi:hypothetical protein
MAGSSACRKNMLPYSSLGIPYMILETITISTPLPIINSACHATATANQETHWTTTNQATATPHKETNISPYAPRIKSSNG